MGVFQNKMYLIDSLKKHIKNLFEKNIYLCYLQRVCRYVGNKDYMNKVLKIDRDPDSIAIKRFGDMNPEKNIYLIKIENPVGFFAVLRLVLYALKEAETLGFIPVIQYADNCLYKENKKINGTDNPFEYYFKQPMHISLEEAYKSARVFLFNWFHIKRIEQDLCGVDKEMVAGYEINEELLVILGEMTKKYIHLNENTKEIIEKNINEMIMAHRPAKILGVHIRGTDFMLAWDNHPVPVTTADFFEAIDEALEQGFQYVFLATEDQDRLEECLDRYGDKILYYKDVNRSRGTGWVVDAGSERMHNKYLNGLEVIRDAYTLASCDGFIGGLSQVAFGARYIKKSFDQEYEYLVIIDKGIRMSV